MPHACMSQKSEAVCAMQRKHAQPEVEGDAGECREVDSNLRVRSLVLPRENGRQEGDQKHKAVGQ